MPHTISGVQDLYAPKTRTLEEAAHAAYEIAAAEHLPIATAHTGNPEQWHRECILKTVPVYGRRNRKIERVPATVLLQGNNPQWSDLTVRPDDFRHYLDWLHSTW